MAAAKPWWMPIGSPALRTAIVVCGHGLCQNGTIISGSPAFLRSAFRTSAQTPTTCHSTFGDRFCSGRNHSMASRCASGSTSGFFVPSIFCQG